MTTGNEMIDRICRGDRVTIARAISIVENEHTDAIDLLKKIYSHTGHAYRVGITGPPGRRQKHNHE